MQHIWPDWGVPQGGGITAPCYTFEKGPQIEMMLSSNWSQKHTYSRWNIGQMHTILDWRCICRIMTWCIALSRCDSWASCYKFRMNTAVFRQSLMKTNGEDSRNFQLSERKCLDTRKSTFGKQEAQLSPRDCTMLCVSECFATSHKVIQGHSKSVPD